MDIRNFSKQNQGQGTAPNQSFVAGSESSTIDATTNNQEANLTPDNEIDDVITEYLAYLKEHDIHKEDIMAVLDAIISNGELFWSFELLDHIPVVFKMRPAWVNEKLTERLDNTPPKTFARFSDLIGLYNLAGSIVKYNSQELVLENLEDLETNIRFVSSLPFILQNKLIKQMAIFDRVVAVATSDWAIENFSKPQQEEPEQKH